MHDLRWIREHAEEFDRGLMRRGLPPHSEQILALDRAWRTVETTAQEAQARREDQTPFEDEDSDLDDDDAGGADPGGFDDPEADEEEDED